MNKRYWNIAYAEAKGISHAKTGTPCQDKTYGVSCGKVHVIALADGAGSARLSQFGAETVTQTISKYVLDNFDELHNRKEADTKATLVEQIRGCLKKLSLDLECEVNDLSSTLLLVAVKQETYFALHVGDGAIGCLRGDALEVLSAPENGEYANITWFTTATNLEKALRIYSGNASRISGFILMSDGTESSLFDRNENRLASAVMNILYVNAKTNSTEMKRLLEESLALTLSKRTGDDCSIAILSRTRFKNFDEYRKYRKAVVKRRMSDKKGAT